MKKAFHNQAVDIAPQTIKRCLDVRKIPSKIQLFDAQDIESICGFHRYRRVVTLCYMRSQTKARWHATICTRKLPKYKVFFERKLLFYCNNVMSTFGKVFLDFLDVKSLKLMPIKTSLKVPLHRKYTI